MKIVNGYKLLDYARENKVVLPAFNTTNWELTSGIVDGLEATGIGGFIEISSSNLQLSSPELIVDMVKAKLKNKAIPVALHLDHGKSFEDVKRCIDAGFTSVMIDASHLPFEKNVEEVKRAVEYAHFFNVPVEAEIGAIGGKEEDKVLSLEDTKTNPEEVSAFVEQTKIDTVAVSIGNVHGLDLKPKIDFPLLEDISHRVAIPLVLHGGSGIPFEHVRQTREYGVIKVNYGADLRRAFIKTFGQEYEKNHNAFDVKSLSVAAIKNVSQTVQSIMKEINP